jgi:predicted nuclease of predicted toxin-antitoxin system
VNAPDEEWIALVGRNEWLAITKDKNIRYRAAELRAIQEHCAKILVIRAKNATGQDIATILVKAKSRIQQFARNHKAPFVAGIDRSGRVSKYDLPSTN